MKRNKKRCQLTAALLSAALLVQPLPAMAVQAQQTESAERNSAEDIKRISVLPAEHGLMKMIYADPADFDDLDSIKEKMPRTIKAFLEDGTETELSVSWKCSQQQGAGEGFYYQFNPVFEDQYSVNEDGANLPYIGVSFSGRQAVLQAKSAIMQPRTVTGTSNEQTVYNFLRNELGLNTAAACGVLANIHDESSFNPKALNANDTGGTQSYGICQWNNGADAKDRYGQLRTWCQNNGYDYTSLTGQLNFMKYELQSNGYFEYSRLKNSIPDTADGAAEASLLWSIKYEGVAESRRVPRQNLARNSYWPAYASPSQLDTQPPVISNIRVETDANGYWIRCTVTDNVGVDRVLFPTWTLVNDQDDLVGDWIVNPSVRGTISGNEVSFYVRRSDHNGEYGSYVTDIYAYDSAGNVATARQGVDMNTVLKTSLTNAEISFPNLTRYTGDPVYPDEQVEINGKILTEGTDYELDGWENNIEPGQGKLTIRGIGRYEGTACGEFTIRPASFANVQIRTADDSIIYTGEEILPELDIRFNGTTLSRDDYKVSGLGQSTNAGVGTVLVTGLSPRFEGEETFKFIIDPAPIDDGIIEGLADIYAFNGSPVCPQPVVRVGSRVLTLGTDYSLSYYNNTEIGMGTLFALGDGNYSGSLGATFFIGESSSDHADLAYAEITGLRSKYIYTGSAIEPELLVREDGETLIEGTDYAVSYSDNVNPGTAEVLLTGLGKYAGSSAVRSFQIAGSLANHPDLQQMPTTVEISLNYPEIQDSFSFTESGKWTDFDQDLNGMIDNREADRLMEDTLDSLGIDLYRIESIGDFNSSYPGNSSQIYIRINVSLDNPWENEQSVYTMSFVDQQTHQTVGSKTFVWKDLAPRFSNHNSLLTIIPDDYAPEGYSIAPLAEGQSFYAGIFGLKEFTVPVVRTVSGKTSIRNALIHGLHAQYPSTGSWIFPDFEVMVDGLALRENVDYEVEYQDNLIPGTAKIIITGIGDYTDTKVVSFTITEPSSSTVKMHRLYNPNSGEHFYTASDNEKNFLVKTGWKYEGEGWKAPQTSRTPVYRLYNENAGDHHYTVNKTEHDFLVSVGWKDEGIGWYSDDSKSVPLYRQYNPNAKAVSHNYTTNWNEHSFLIQNGWDNEGIAWYGAE